MNYFYLSVLLEILLTHIFVILIYNFRSFFKFINWMLKSTSSVHPHHLYPKQGFLKIDIVLTTNTGSCSKGLNGQLKKRTQNIAQLISSIFQIHRVYENLYKNSKMSWISVHRNLYKTIYFFKEIDVRRSYIKNLHLLKAWVGPAILKGEGEGTIIWSSCMLRMRLRMA